MYTTELDNAYIAGTYARLPVVFCSGKGALLFDENGKQYIDLGSGIGVNCFGYGDRAWSTAVAQQAAKLQHVSNLYYTQPQAELAQLLCEKSGMRKVFFCNSGTEANEAAIKAARKYGNGRDGIVTLHNSFHGRTIAALSATGQPAYQAGFAPLLPGFTYAAPNDIADLQRAVRESNCCAILLETIQGEGGVVPLSREFVQAAASLAEELDLLLIIDEVQTGIGRTGKFFSYMYHGIQPDIVTAAKGLGGGLPIGAVLFGRKTQDVLTAGTHGSTFGGNPICAAGALNILQRLDSVQLLDIKRKGAYIFNALKDKPGVKQITGKGMMLGIETEKPPAQVMHDCLANGVVVLTAKEKVRLLPPFNIPMDLLQQALDVLAAAL